ncbi:MAG: TetR/AcrR family transcriptional regulator [Dehalococcoidia bacterium]|nr:TetR/AcrR family transcriptional regulator [Dehalococcoidia bacterium]
MTVRTYSPDEVLVQERRRQIVIAAAALFIKQGFLKTTVREIATHSGMSIGTLYHYVGSKDDILSLFEEAAFSSLATFTQQSSSAQNDMTPSKALRQAIADYLSFIDEIQDVIVFWYQETRNLPATHRRYLFQQEEDCANLFGRPLARGCECGEFKIANLPLAAHSIVVLCDMWAFRRWFLRKHFTLEQYTAQLTELVFSGLRGDRAETVSSF